MQNSFKVQKNMNLSLKEELVYAVISCNSDEDGLSHITRKEIAKRTGIKKEDTITEYTNKLEKEGLIEKTHHVREGKKLVTYKVRGNKRDFM